MAAMTSSSKMNETILMVAPHVGHARESTSKTRFNNSAQRCLMARRAGQSAVAPSAVGETLARVPESVRIPALR
jgi:hypothetical protein